MAKKAESPAPAWDGDAGALKDDRATRQINPTLNGRRLGFQPRRDLHCYQLEALVAVYHAMARGVRRQLLVLPAGSGKTIIFVELALRRVHIGRVLVLVHRVELIQQAVAAFRAADPDVRIGVVKSRCNEISAQVVVASVQTLCRPERLAMVGSDFATVIVDEAHHATADSYVRILKHLRCLAPNGPLTVGVTATAERADGIGLEQIWEEIVYHRDILSLTKQGYLCSFRVVPVRIAVDLDRVHRRAGDFAAGELDTALRGAGAFRLVVAAYRRHATGRKALVYTATVASAHKMAAAFRKAGISAEAINGKATPRARQAVLDRFRSGKTIVLVNCALLTEGFDEPSIDCIVIARPTLSRPLFEQMMGRGNRTHPGKSDCLIIDLVGASDRHAQVSVASLLGLPPKAFRAQRIGHKAARRKRAIEAPQKKKRVPRKPRRPRTGWTPLITWARVTLSFEFLCAGEGRL
jgi:superfamily II DNA or RNA helicase